MAAIKRFFEKRKLDVKFKKAGGGHKLTEDTRELSAPKAGSSSSHYVPPTSDARRAGSAALARLDAPRPGTAGTGPKLSSMKSQVREEVLEERRALEKARKRAEQFAQPKEMDLVGAPVLAVNGVFYKCAITGPVVLPKAEMEAHIEEFLLSQLAEEPEMSAALMIHTFSKDPDKGKMCIETLCRIIDNIVAHPTEEKYRKLKATSKVLTEKVLPLKGSHEFIQAMGFEVKLLPGANGVEDSFYFMDEDRAKDAEKLVASKDILLASEPIKPELDRNTKVFHGGAGANRMEVPREFYSISPEELKKEQQLRAEAVEKMGMLMTKEMRERDRQRELRRYRFALVRVRFPNHLILQGTFRSQDKFCFVREFVRECLSEELSWIPFYLSTSTGHKILPEDDAQTLAELNLAPATILNFDFDKQVVQEMSAQQGSTHLGNYLRADLLQSIQEL